MTRSSAGYVVVRLGSIPSVGSPREDELAPQSCRCALACRTEDGVGSKELLRRKTDRSEGRRSVRGAGLPAVECIDLREAAHRRFVCDAVCGEGALDGGAEHRLIRALPRLFRFPDVDFSNPRWPRVTRSLGLAAALEPDVVIALDEPYRFSTRHEPELRRVAPTVFVDGRDLFWWGVRTASALDRLSTILEP